MKTLIRSLLRTIWSVTPRRLKDVYKAISIKWRLHRNYAYDHKRYKRWSGLPVHEPSRINLRSLITMDYHRVEKGLSLAAPRPGFGKPTIVSLIRNLNQYLDRFGIDSHAIVATNALRAYSEFNRRHNATDESIDKQIERLEERVKHSEVCHARGGIIELSREQIQNASTIDLTEFFASRHSIRSFSGKPVPRQLIERAVAMAQKTPSVCNRQAWRVYCFHDGDKKKAVLAHQNGNRGFGEQASWVLVVTCNLGHFVSVGERNQAWIDGGMFAMSLLYALHSLGLGACPLNWSVEKETNEALRKTAQLDEQDATIMLIAVGHLPDNLCVAQSPRKSLDEVIFFPDAPTQPSQRTEQKPPIREEQESGAAELITIKK